MSRDNRLPPGWVSVRLGDVLTLQRGYDLPTEQRRNGPIPIFAANGPIGYHDEAKVKGPGVITGRSGTIGKVHYVDGDYWPLNTALYVRDFGGSDPKFLLYLLRNFALDKYYAGTGVPTLNRNVVHEEPTAIPPLNEQKRIASKIEALQARSDAAKQALDAIPPLLEQLRQSVLAAAFRGDLTKAWREAHPDVEPASELLERIRAERRRKWEEANPKKKYVEPEAVDAEGLPELPVGWCWVRWEEIGFCQNGRAFPSEFYCDGGTKLLRPGNLHVSGRVEWNEGNTRWMPDEWATDHPGFLIGPDELVMNLTAQSLKDEFLGRVCLTGADERCLLNQRIARLSPVIASARFCLWLFKSRVFRQYVEGLNTGSLIQHIFTSQVYDFVLPLPPAHEQDAIVKRVEELIGFRESVSKSVGTMADQLPLLTQSILAKAFRGELVPQDPNDEPASVLLDRIRAERSATAAAPKPKRSAKPKQSPRKTTR